MIAAGSAQAGALCLLESEASSSSPTPRRTGAGQTHQEAHAAAGFILPLLRLPQQQRQLCLLYCDQISLRGPGVLSTGRIRRCSQTRTCWADLWTI